MNASDCDAVILCGGKGERLQSEVSDAPKVMAIVDGQPFLDFVIDYLKGQGIARVVLCTGYKAEMVEEFYASNERQIEIVFSREEEPLGTGGAVRLAQASIRSDTFFVVNGDSFLPADLKGFLDFHLSKEAAVSIIVAKVQEGGDYGNIMLDENGRIIDFQEKEVQAGKTLVNAGTYCFDRSVFKSMPGQNAFSLEHEFFPSLAGGNLFGYIVDEEFLDIGTPERYRLAREKLKKRK